MCVYKHVPHDANPATARKDVYAVYERRGLQWNAYVRLSCHTCMPVCKSNLYYYYNDDDDAKLARATFLPQLRIAVMHAARESVRARDVLLRTFIHVCCRACVQRCVCLLRAQATTSHARAKAFFVNRCLHCQAPTRTPALWPITSSYSILTASLCD